MSDLRILIVEDEPSIAEGLEEILEVLGHSCCGVADSGESFLKAIDGEEPDLILLDINLKGSLSGIDLARLIRRKYQVPFVFTTAFADNETLDQAKQESPYGYVIKPYGINDIKVAVELAVDQFRKQSRSQDFDQVEKKAQDPYLYLKVDGRLVKVAEEDILYVEAKGDYMLFKTAQKGHVVHSTMKKVKATLSEERFFPCHRSFLVNLASIEDIEDGTLVIGQKVIPVSRGQRQELLQRIRTL